MAKIKFTDKGIKALAGKPHPKRIDYFDADRSGLCLTIGPRAAVWYVFRRIDGKLVRLRIGAWPEYGIKKARTKAGRVEEDIEAGKHPKPQQARQKADKRHSREVDYARLFERAAEAWQEHHLPGLADQTQTMYKRACRRLVAEFEGRDIGTIKRGELVRFLDSLKAASESGVPANHAAATIRLIFGYAADRLELETNPAAGLKNPAKVKSRDRVLSRAEIRIVWRAAEMAGYPYGHAIRFQLCTGQRIGEIGDIRRDDLEGDSWKLSRTKTGKRIDVYLAHHARSILDDCPDFGDDAPFFSASSQSLDDGTQRARSLQPDGFHLALKRHIRPRLDAAAHELDLPRIREHWTPHDLRRTVRSGLTGWAGVFPDIAERTINHSIGGIRAVYDHADYRAHEAEALKAWDAELSRILAGEQATVVPMRRAMT